MVRQIRQVRYSREPLRPQTPFDRKIQLLDVRRLHVQQNRERRLCAERRIGNKCIGYRRRGRDRISIELQVEVGRVNQHELQLVVLKRRVVNSVSSVQRGPVHGIGKTDARRKREVLLSKRARMVCVCRQVINIEVTVRVGWSAIIVVTQTKVERKYRGNPPVVLDIRKYIPLDEVGDRYSGPSLGDRREAEQHICDIASTYERFPVIGSVLSVESVLTVVPNTPISIESQPV